MHHDSAHDANSLTPKLRSVVPPPDTVGEPCRVLIIDDHADSADSLGLLLRQYGYTVAITYSGRTGIEAARRIPPRVVVCDISLPDGMDGYAVARALRADAQLGGTYLVALSGYDREEDQRRALEAGFDVHLTKPVDCAALQLLLASATRITSKSLMPQMERSPQ